MTGGAGYIGSHACKALSRAGYGETKLAVERALPQFERAVGLRWAALRYVNAAGADPDGELGEDHAPEILYAASQKAQAALHWTPRWPDLESIVRTAWEWRRTHPRGYKATAHS